MAVSTCHDNGCTCHIGRIEGPTKADLPTIERAPRADYRRFAHRTTHDAAKEHGPDMRYAQQYQQENSACIAEAGWALIFIAPVAILMVVEADRK